ncbi:hypothetical protein IOD16_05660 [Saccharothrix sp. 6-C]|uniref:Uncharacterized protein n=1 Tax=Saccharothrix texasensis TaxID=103734 RepID=A0A3N1H4V3_9PSEU|nr:MULTISPECIES: hypothetical protein [Saccharothrix]QQQ77976.1 hypothetical protein IOD16_05660 [Saccharothrix sp. 6-C]ROP37554.1 hypothetical protein EDD40_2871 [Saccharothrix texasensis]
MGSRFYQVSLIETSGTGVYFRTVTRELVDGKEELHPWMVRMLLAHGCDLGLYVGETGTIAADEDQVDADLWLAWDGVAAFATTE